MKTVETYRVLNLLDPDKTIPGCPGAICMHTEYIEEDFAVSYYFGPSGKHVAFVISDEIMDEVSLYNNLELLGLLELMPILFPADPDTQSDKGITI